MHVRKYTQKCALSKQSFLYLVSLLHTESSVFCQHHREAKLALPPSNSGLAFALTFYMLLKIRWDKVCSSCCAPQFVSGSWDTTITSLHVFDQSNILCSFRCKTTDRWSVFLLALCGFVWCKVLQSREQASRDKPPMIGHSTSLPCPGSKQLELLHRFFVCFFFFRHTAPQRPSPLLLSTPLTWSLFLPRVTWSRTYSTNKRACLL